MSNGPFYKLSLSTRNSCTPSMQFGSKVFQIPWTIVRQFKTVILKMCMCWPVIYWRCSSVAEVNRLLNLIGWRAAYIHGRVTRSCICHSIKFLSSPTTEGRCVSHIADFFSGVYSLNINNSNGSQFVSKGRNLTHKWNKLRSKKYIVRL